MDIDISMECLEDDRWFHETRVNQVMFFDDPEDLKKDEEDDE